MNSAVAPARSSQVFKEIQASAWVLKLSPCLKAAISQYELNHIEENPRLVSIPKSPAWCENVMLWRNQIIPVVDLSDIKETALDLSEQKHNCIIAITRYTDDNERGYSYGAIRILNPPVLETVSNEQICQLEDIDSRLQSVSLSGFHNKDSAVGILNLKALFSAK